VKRKAVTKEQLTAELKKLRRRVIKLKAFEQRYKQAEEELKKLATIDTLMEVYNRRTGLALLENQIKQANRYNKALTICYIDLNNFKEINDSYGHKEGDEVLKLVAKLVKETIRDSDVVCRLGGDELLIIFPCCSLDKANAIWKKITRRLGTVNAERDKPYQVSLSRGFAEYDPTRDISMEQLLAIADKEMYRDKYC